MSRPIIYVTEVAFISLVRSLVHVSADNANTIIDRFFNEIFFKIIDILLDEEDK